MQLYIVQAFPNSKIEKFSLNLSKGCVIEIKIICDKIFLNYGSHLATEGVMPFHCDLGLTFHVSRLLVMRHTEKRCLFFIQIKCKKCM